MPAPSRLVIQTIKDVTCVTITDSSVVDAQLIEGIKKELFELVDKQDRRKLTLDMSKVQYLSSTALGVLIPLNEKILKLKGSLYLCGVSPEIMKVFKITKLDKIFKFKNTEGEALSDLGVTKA
jgi:anti-sigma B factor antagonist